jgi:ribosomal protein S1
MGKSNFRSEAPVQRASEPYFPRGEVIKEKKPPSEFNKDEKIKEVRFVRLFGEAAKRAKEQELKKKRTEEKKKEQKSIFDVIANNVPSLAYEHLKEGMVMTATVASISDYKVVVCLPFYLHATLAITNISTQFTELLRTAAHDNTEDNMDVDDIPSMEGLFRVGQFLVVAISSIKKNDQDVYDVNVTLDPKMVMANRNLKQGDLCVASVKSKEEYGYVMKLEGTKCSGFLSKDSADSYCNNLPLGSVVICYVAKKHGSVLTLKCDQDNLNKNLKNSSEASLYNTMPGSLIRTKVEQVMENGIKVTYGTNAFGYIHQDLLPSKHDNPENYSPGQEVVARIVMVLPTLNSFIMSAKSFYPHQNNWVSNCSFGEVFKDALIRRVTDDQLSLELKAG